MWRVRRAGVHYFLHTSLLAGPTYSTNQSRHRQPCRGAMRDRFCRWRCGRLTDRRCVSISHAATSVIITSHPVNPTSRQRPGHRFYKGDKRERIAKQKAATASLNQQEWWKSSANNRQRSAKGIESFRHAGGSRTLEERAQPDRLRQSSGDDPRVRTDCAPPLAGDNDRGASCNSPNAQLRSQKR